jgi:hypothetical protein
MVAQPLHLPDAPSDAEQGAIVPGSPQDQIDHGRKVAQGYWPVRS